MQPYKDHSQQHIQVRGFSHAVRVAARSSVASKGRAQVLRPSSVPGKTFLVVMWPWSPAKIFSTLSRENAPRILATPLLSISMDREEGLYCFFGKNTK